MANWIWRPQDCLQAMRKAAVVCGMVAAILAWERAGSAELPPPAEREVDFEKDIRPILASACLECHEGEAAKKQLRLDTVVGILRGGDSGEPLYLRGSSADSLLIKRLVTDNPKELMPAESDPLTPEQIGLVRKWIDSGAKMPGEEVAAASLQLRTDHWSFQPVKRPVLPTVQGAPFVRGAIDAFILAKMQEKRLEPSEEADRATLIRRLYLIALGLPPMPDEVAEFVSDTHSDAYERLVDRVQASPRYGERWARHWMDVVRYADTNGFETNRERKTAFHYRDYLVAAWNADKPYDQFVREQIAGDALGVDAATGFLVAGAYDIVKAPDINLTLAQRQDELADMVNTTGTAFMGLTMGCARCHNHKFDPILQRDYYSMQAVFAGTNHGERIISRKLEASGKESLAQLQSAQMGLVAELETLKRKGILAAKTGPMKMLRPAVNARINEENFAPVTVSSLRFTITATNASEPCIDELEVYDSAGENVALATKGARPTASGTLPGYAIHKLENLNDGKAGNNHSWISNTSGTGWVQIDLPARTTIQRVVWGRDRNGQFGDRVATRYTLEGATESGKWFAIASSQDRVPFQAEMDPNAYLAKLSAEDVARAKGIQQSLADIKREMDQLTGAEQGWIGTFSQPDKTYRLYRGEAMQRREVVAPDALTVLGSLGMKVDEPEQQRRIRLANWITSQEHPLTGRVVVNRLWHYTFGRGIVDTPSDFGVNGSRPTHPELLDWLADELVHGGWSLKRIERQILQSSAFRQSSKPNEKWQAIDADGRYLWRYSPRRLEAEAIRDSMLSVSGAMDLRMGGPGFYLMDVVVENVMHYFPKEKYTSSEFRRMIYLFRIRAAHDGVFGAFDCPDGGQVMANRSRSNTPLQALNLFNSSFILQQSELLAARLSQEAGNSSEKQVELAFTLFYARHPDDYELRLSTEMIQEQGLTSFCRAMFNTSEFLFVF